jgi:hypothetical protein
MATKPPPVSPILITSRRKFKKLREPYFLGDATICNSMQSLKTRNHPLLIKPGSRNRKIGSLFEDPSGEVALDMARLSKRWQILELYSFNGHVYATPTLINPCVFR